METTEQLNDLVINEGDCFGWYSSVASDCQPNKCTQSERCKQYTVTLQQSDAGPTILEELETFDKKEKDSAENEKAAAKKDQLVDKAYFDQVINLVKTLVEHDDVNIHEKRGYASVKRDGRVVVFINKTKKLVKVVIGNHKGDKKQMCELIIGEDWDTLKEKLTKFIKQHTR